MQKKFHFASHDHSKYDYLEGIIISVLPTRNPIKEYLRNNFFRQLQETVKLIVASSIQNIVEFMGNN